jgi:putative transposase
MTNYPTNVSDSQWQIISKFLDLKRKRKIDLREVVNGILYLVKTGCQWRMLPGDFPKWERVYYYFNTWKKKGIIEKIHEALVEKTRKEEDREKQPSAAIIDAQSVKATLVSSESKGFDAGKKIKGIKRHIIVDTLGLVLAVVIHSASIQDRDGAKDVIEQLKDKWKRVIKIFADGGYRGQLIQWAKEHFKIDLEIVKRNELHLFKILPKRWIVERTLSWLDTNRRNSKFYERLDNTGVAMVHLSSIRIMLNRLE